MGMQKAKVIVLWKFVQMFQKATEEARQGMAGSGSLQRGPERGHCVWLYRYTQSCSGKPQNAGEAGTEEPAKENCRQEQLAKDSGYICCVHYNWMGGATEAPGAQVLLPRARHAHKRLNR